MYTYQKIFGTKSEVASMYSELAVFGKKKRTSDDELPPNVQYEQSLRPTHSLISGGNLYVPDSQHDAFYAAYIDDVVRDYTHSFVATPGVPQNAISENGHAAVFPLFFDIDLVFSAVPKENDQSMVGLLCRNVQSSVRQSIPGRSDEDWRATGGMTVTQTLGRPVIPQSAFVSLSRRPNKDSPDARGPSLAHSTSSLSSGSNQTLLYGHGSKSLDGFDSPPSLGGSGTGRSTVVPALDEAAQDGFGFGAASSALGGSSYLMLNEDSNPMAMSSHMEISSGQLPRNGDASSSSLGGSSQSSSRSDDFPLAESISWRPRIIMRDNYDILCKEPATTLVAPLIMQTIPAENQVAHVMGVNIVFEKVLVNVELAHAIRAKVVYDLASLFVTRQDILETTSLRAYKSDATSIPMKDLNFTTIKKSCEVMVDPKVWSGPSPHKRSVFSHKTIDCVCRSVRSGDSGGGDVTSSQAPRSKKRAAPTGGKRSAANSYPKSRAGSSWESPLSYDDPSQDDDACRICGGSGVADSGAAAVACMSYCVDGFGETPRFLIENNLDERSSDYADAHRRKHYVHSQSRLAFPHLGRHDAHFVQRRVVERGARTPLEKILAEKPVEINAVSAGSPAMKICTLPVVLKRFPFFEETSSLIKYVRFVVTRTSIRTRMESTTVAESVIKSKLISGIDPSLLDPSVTSSDIPLVHKSHLRRSKGSAGIILRTDDALAGAIPDPLINLNEIKKVAILAPTATKMRLLEFIRRCRPEWAGLQFDNVLYLSSSNPLVSDPESIGAMDALKRATLCYGGPIFLAGATGSGSHYCTIRKRNHSTRRCYFKITPCAVVQVCASHSQDRGGGELPCYATYGEQWILPLALAKELFPGCGGQAKKLLNMLEQSVLISSSLSNGVFTDDGSEAACRAEDAEALAASSSNNALEALSRNAVQEAVALSGTGGASSAPVRATSSSSMSLSSSARMSKSGGVNLGALLNSSSSSALTKSGSQ